MTDIYLSPPAITSALGTGRETTWHHLLAGTETPRRESGWMADPEREVTVCRCPQALEPLPQDTPAYLRSRNNQLLETTLRQIDREIRQAVGRHGTDRIAVVLGTSTSGSDENEQAFRRVLGGASWKDSGYSQDRQLLASPAAYLAWRYAITGPAYGISSACTSGAKTLVSAARLLRMGAVDAVICGGVDSLSSFTLNGFDSLSVLSDAPSRPFGARRRGINIGEGAALFIVTRERSSGVVLLGYAAGSDAYHMSTPRPDGCGARQVILGALRHAALAADEIGWINAHGTGTPANDAMEARAIAAVFGACPPVSSTKTQTGHTLAGAGAVEAAIAWIVCDRASNPDAMAVPQWQTETLDADLAAIHLARPGDRLYRGHRRVLSNSFAFGGDNVALIIGSADD